MILIVISAAAIVWLAIVQVRDVRNASAQTRHNRALIAAGAEHVTRPTASAASILGYAVAIAIVGALAYCLYLGSDFNKQPEPAPAQSEQAQPQQERGPWRATRRGLEEREER